MLWSRLDRKRSELQDFYNARVAEAGDQALAHHVYHTLGGIPLPPETLEAMGAALWQHLDLGPQDHLLDLCCGNGIFSRMAAHRAGSVTGVDFSSELVRVAQSAPGPKGLRFLHGDALGLQALPELRDRPYSKVLMNCALQHFAPRASAHLLDQILSVTTKTPVILLSYVPERGKEHHFFDTPTKRMRRAWLKLTGRDVFGHWWCLDDIKGPAAARGLAAEALRLSPGSPYAPYRMHLRLKGRI